MGKRSHNSVKDALNQTKEIDGSAIEDGTISDSVEADRDNMDDNSDFEDENQSDREEDDTKKGVVTNTSDMNAGVQGPVPSATKTREDSERNFSNFVPQVGQVFSMFQDIEATLKAFALSNSFTIIIMRSQRPGKKVVQATFGCYKSGYYRPNKTDPHKYHALDGVDRMICGNDYMCRVSQSDTGNNKSIKTNCPFQINIRWSDKTGEYRITKVALRHNHALCLDDVKPNLINRSRKRKSDASIVDSLAGSLLDINSFECNSGMYKSGHKYTKNDGLRIDSMDDVHEGLGLSKESSSPMISDNNGTSSVFEDFKSTPRKSIGVSSSASFSYHNTSVVQQQIMKSRTGMSPNDHTSNGKRPGSVHSYVQRLYPPQQFNADINSKFQSFPEHFHGSEMDKFQEMSGRNANSSQAHTPDHMMNNYMYFRGMSQRVPPVDAQFHHMPIQYHVMQNQGFVPPSSYDYGVPQNMRYGGMPIQPRGTKQKNFADDVVHGRQVSQEMNNEVGNNRNQQGIEKTSDIERKKTTKYGGSDDAEREESDAQNESLENSKDDSVSSDTCYPESDDYYHNFQVMNHGTMNDSVNTDNSHPIPGINYSQTHTFSSYDYNDGPNHVSDRCDGKFNDMSLSGLELPEEIERDVVSAAIKFSSWNNNMSKDQGDQPVSEDEKNEISSPGR